MKIWLIVAVCLVLAGTALFAVAMSANDWDFTKLSTTKYIENVHEISEPFENIYIDTDTADVTFYFSEGDVCRVVCEEEEKLAHSVALSDGTLNVHLRHLREKVEENSNSPEYIKTVRGMGIMFKE